MVLPFEIPWIACEHDKILTKYCVDLFLQIKIFGTNNLTDKTKIKKIK